MGDDARMYGHLLDSQNQDGRECRDTTEVSARTVTLLPIAFASPRAPLSLTLSLQMHDICFT